MGCASSTASGADVEKAPNYQQSHLPARLQADGPGGRSANGHAYLDSPHVSSKQLDPVGASGKLAPSAPSSSSSKIPASPSQAVAPLTQQLQHTSSKAIQGKVLHDQPAQSRAHGHDGQEGKGKERRAAAGTDAVREQMRKMAVGGAPGKDDKTAVYAVSDSEEEDTDTGASDPVAWQDQCRRMGQDVAETLRKALSNSDVFRGMPDHKLTEVMARMKRVEYSNGDLILQQGAMPKPDDCMYFLQSGDVEVQITGAVDGKSGGEDWQFDDHKKWKKIQPTWLFGDIALLFNSIRTASIIARSETTVVWALDRKQFMHFAKNAPGARLLRFLRKLPLLKGLSDTDLVLKAKNLQPASYQDGEALVKYGERGDQLFLIRHGKVRVLRPDGKGGRIEAVVLSRGQFVGERAVINDRLRSADCVAQGHVDVVVLHKRDFLNLDNPLLAWMLDYDAVSACLRAVSSMKGLKQEQMEHLLDRFDQKEQFWKDQVVIKEGDLVDRLTVCKIGEVQLYRDNQPASDPSFVKEFGGFTYFGEDALKEPFKSKYTVKVSSDTLYMLSLPKRSLDAFLGNDSGLASEDQVVAAVKKSKHLAALSDTEIKKILQLCQENKYQQGEVVAAANGPNANRVFLVKSGEVVQVPADVPLPGQVDLGHIQERSRLVAGQLFNDDVVANPSNASLKASLVAASPNAVIISFTTSDIEKVAGSKALARAGGGVNAIAGFKSVKFSELEFHRIVGTGQFGLVRVVRHIKTNEVFALKVMHKAPITESKQVEHVINERKILQEATHPFCVKLCGAYQDRNALYLLQEWVPGGELFHHLDLEGAFDEPTAKFFAASVLLALESLHVKNIVYRDLKPENLLLDGNGYIKLADFGFAKYIGSDKTYTICGTPDYQAPEVIMRRGTTKAADYWALGVLIFEMLVGDPPFKSLTGDPWDTFRRTLSGRFYVPNFIGQEAADLIFKLLQVNPEKRLGSGPDGANEIKRHKWFADLDWNLLLQRKLEPKIKVTVRNPLDTSNFDNFDNCDVEPPPVPANRLEKHAELWELWEWIEPPPAA